MIRVVLALCLVGFSFYGEERVVEKYIYKVISMENWNLSQGQHSLRLSSMDDHFVHFAKEGQLEGVLRKFWSHVPKYIVLKIDPIKLVGDLVFETNPGGKDKYYHLYNGHVPLEAVVEVNHHEQGS